MKTFQIKKDKWYHSDYSIYFNNQLVGEFLPENFKNSNRLSLRDKYYTLQKKSIWKDEKEIYLGNIKIGEIIPKPFKDQAIINIIGQGEFILKKTSTWKSIRTLFRGEQAIAECRSKDFSSTFTIGDQIDENVLAAMMFVSMQQKHAYVAFIALIPVFITIFN
ncbi:MAG: hypothetical protein PF541_15455 [Prolixibacteraceae bacterium]|jgi:hypothetical protein|nr:hypothetical protein [Prolixibacteraceae bacterium]